MTPVGSDEACLDPDDIAAFLTARLDPASVDMLEQHVAVCGACRELLSALAQTASVATHATTAARAHGDGSGCDAALAPTVPACPAPRACVAPGTRIGRYVVSARLGAGAMGEVYIAEDPELARNVALKILSRRLAAGEQVLVRDRLWLEAQAMAKLAHPNVVSVYDVGAVDDAIFISMELVVGETLAAWLTRARRDWRAVLEMFLAAGQGLSAAHSAGLVHRDFKPENVLVGNDGRVRVCDFGLARISSPAPSPDPEISPGSDGRAGSASMTGAFVGTPYYMAPEQLRCEHSDMRTDQFSFCVALYAAIAHQHPFDWEDPEGLADAVTGGRRRPPPGRMVLPRWLLRVLLRGMAIEPSERFPSMDALLTALADDPRPRRVRAIAIAAAALVVAGGAALLRRGDDQPLLCTGAERKWVGIWDPPRAQAVARAFDATHTAYAAAVYRTVAHALDTYRAAWSAMHTEACEATRVRGDQTEDMLARRMQCLDARLRDARALVDRFELADAETVEHAPTVVHSLGDLTGCADVQALSSQVPPPSDSVTAMQVTGLRTVLADLRALRVAGHAGEATVRVARVVAAARATGYRPLEAEAQLERCAISSDNGDVAGAAPACEQAVWVSEAGRDDETTAHAWLRLMHARRSQARYEQALTLVPRVTALLARLGGNDELEGDLHAESAASLLQLERIPEAQAEAETARAVLERRFGGDDLRVADALDRLGDIALRASRFDDALGDFRRELSIKQRAFGGDHPAVAAVLYSIAALQANTGRYEEALGTFGRAQAIYERTLRPDHPTFAALANGIGESYAALGELDRALAMFRRACAVGALAYGKDHPTYATFLVNLGGALEGLSRYDEALAALHEALAILRHRLGPRHVRVAICLEEIARVWFERGRLAKAREAIVEAVAIYEQALGGHDPDSRQALLVLGEIEIKLGAAARAIAPLERAYAFGADTDRGVYAQIQWDLGRALVDAHRDRARGMKLVAAARAEFQTDHRQDENLAELTRWASQRR
jgi:tetratricopeptide (TPR) repeat protein